MSNGIKIKLDRLKWQTLHELLRLVMDKAPIEGFELESLIMVDTYARLLHQLTFFKPNAKGEVTISLRFAEAFAINGFWASHSDIYNVLLRPQIESKLPPSKPDEL